MLLHWRCCYVEDVVTNAFKSALWMWRENKNSCAFRPWSSGELWHLFVNQKKPEIPKKHAIPMESTKLTYNKELQINNKTFKQQTTYPKYVLRMLNWFLVLSSYGKNTKHCKTQSTITFFKVDNNELQLPSGEPQASTHIYIYIYIYIYYSTWNMLWF